MGGSVLEAGDLEEEIVGMERISASFSITSPVPIVLPEVLSPVKRAGSGSSWRVVELT